MKPFGTPVRRFDLESYDPEECAAWLLGIVDEGPDKLAIIKMPPHRDLEELDELEALFIAAYDVAKAERPNLSVKILHAADLHNGQERDRIAVAVHEHQWVGGQCVNGCPDTRKGD
jgi:hypothetical protein